MSVSYSSEPDSGTVQILTGSFFSREQALKKRLAVVQDSLSSALSDSASNRRDNEEQVARLTQAHRYICSLSVCVSNRNQILFPMH